MFYCLTENQIRQLYCRRLKPSQVLTLNHTLLFTYTGEDVLEYAGRKRAIAPDLIDSIAESCLGQTNMGDVLSDVVDEVVGPMNKVSELDQ